MEEQKRNQIERRLKDIRREMVEKRDRLEDARMNLKQDQIELEERAANQQLAGGLEQLDERGEEVIAAINEALDRLERGEYQNCRSCGSSIAEGRLEALPWMNLCRDCAERAEEGKTPTSEILAEETAEKNEAPAELQGLDDQQRTATVTDALVRDGQVPLDDLRISTKDGQLRLEGVLPDERQLSRLQQIVYDVLGFSDVVEEIRIDRTAWARQDRTAGIREKGEKKQDSADGSGLKTIEAVKEGKTINPADEIVPEKRGGDNER